MVLTNITNKKNMAERQPPLPHEDDIDVEKSPRDLNMPLAKRIQLIRDKQLKEESSEKIASGGTRKTVAKGNAFKTKSFTPFVVFEDCDVDSNQCSDIAEESTQNPPSTPLEKLFTDIKEKSPGITPERSEINSDPVEEEPIVGVFSRKKSHKGSTSSSDDSVVQRKSPDSKDDNDNTVLQRKRSRRAAIGFPSEVTTAGSSTKSPKEESFSDGKDQGMNMEPVIEKLPSPDELPTGMSADQIADIDKLFDSLVPEFTNAGLISVEPDKGKTQEVVPRKSERRKSTRRASFILPCHMNQPDIPLLEQTDDSTPIQDKKFRLPSSNEDSFTASSITPISEAKTKEAKGSAKRIRSGKKAKKSRTKKRVRTDVGDGQVDVHVEECKTQETSEFEPQQSVGEEHPPEPVVEDDVFTTPVAQVSRPSQAKRRRRSADFDITAQEVQKTPSPSTTMENLPNVAARRSNRIKRRSIEMFRIQLRKDSGEDSPNSSSEGQDTPETVVSCSKVSENIPSVGKEVTESRTSVLSTEESAAATPKSVPCSPDSANVSLNVSIGESPITTPSGTGKGKTRRGKRKRESSIEDIYQNKLWRTQMPKEKSWETIFEEPKAKRGQFECQSVKKYKRFCNFDEFYNQIRLKKRRQKALKRGWKPLTKRKEEKAGKLVDEKLFTLDQKMIEEEMPNISISETLALLGEPLVSLPQEPELIVTASPTKSTIVHTVNKNNTENSKSESRQNVDSKSAVSIVVDEVNNESTRTSSVESSSLSETEYLTPTAVVSKTAGSGKEKELPSLLSAICEDEDEAYYTPVAENCVESDGVLTSVNDATSSKCQDPSIPQPFLTKTNTDSQADSSEFHSPLL